MWTHWNPDLTGMTPGWVSGNADSMSLAGPPDRVGPLTELDPGTSGEVRPHYAT